MRADEDPALGAALARVRAAERRVLLLDYDGTLVPFSSTPELASPDPGLRALITDLARHGGTTVHVVSGRSPEVLERWLGDLPIGLHGEHGLFARVAGGEGWVRTVEVTTGWMASARELFERFVAQTAGSRVELKAATVAWHYRGADPREGERQARSLAEGLAAMAAQEGLEVLAGDMVVELRPRGVHKGLAVAAALAEVGGPACVLAAGDDRTDEDLFAALPPEAVAIHVGPRTSRAPLRLPDPSALRAFLGRILADP